MLVYLVEMNCGGLSRDEWDVIAVKSDPDEARKEMDLETINFPRRVSVWELNGKLKEVW